MKELRYLLCQLKPGDLVYQTTNTLIIAIEDLHEYLGGNKFARIAVKQPHALISEWTYPQWDLLDSKTVPKKDLVLYTHWATKSKRFFESSEKDGRGR